MGVCESVGKTTLDLGFVSPLLLLHLLLLLSFFFFFFLDENDQYTRSGVEGQGNLRYMTKRVGRGRRTQLDISSEAVELKATKIEREY